MINATSNIVSQLSADGTNTCHTLAVV